MLLDIAVTQYVQLSPHDDIDEIKKRYLEMREAYARFPNMEKQAEKYSEALECLSDEFLEGPRRRYHDLRDRWGLDGAAEFTLLLAELGIPEDYPSSQRRTVDSVFRGYFFRRRDALWAHPDPAALRKNARSDLNGATIVAGAVLLGGSGAYFGGPAEALGGAIVGALLTAWALYRYYFNNRLEWNPFLWTQRAMNDRISFFGTRREKYENEGLASLLR